jgi:hypothetical protein
LCSIILLLVLVPQIAMADYLASSDRQERAGAVSETKPGTERKKFGMAFRVFGGSMGILGAAVKFGKDVEGPGYEEDGYNGANYAMMIGGSAIFVLGTTLLISGFEASRVADSAYLDCDRDVTRLGIQLRF